MARPGLGGRPAGRPGDPPPSPARRRPGSLATPGDKRPAGLASRISAPFWPGNGAPWGPGGPGMPAPGPFVLYLPKEEAAAAAAAASIIRVTGPGRGASLGCCLTAAGASFLRPGAALLTGAAAASGRQWGGEPPARARKG